MQYLNCLVVSSATVNPRYMNTHIFINRIQPFEAANISAAFFLCRPMRKNNRCHTFHDISCALAMYSYIRDLLYLNFTYYPECLGCLMSVTFFLFFRNATVTCNLRKYV